MPKCDSIKFLCIFIEIARWHGCSPVNLLHIFRTPFARNTSGWLLLHSDGMDPPQKCFLIKAAFSREQFRIAIVTLLSSYITKTI